jgi:hypothetical protein
VILLAALVLCLASPLAARAERGAGPELLIKKIEVGFRGFYKAGEWTPLWVTIHSTTDRTVKLVIDVPDADDNLTLLPSPPIELKAGVASRIESAFRTGRLLGELQVRVVDDEGATLASRRLRAAQDSSSELRPALRLDVPLWVALGNLSLAGDSPRAESPEHDSGGESDSTSELRLARLDSLEQLPRDWRSLQSVEMLILPTAAQLGDGPLIAHLPEEVDAILREWVGMGGHLLISVGSESDAYRASAMAKWVPIAVEGQMQLRQLSSLEGFSGRHAPVRFSGAIPAARLGKLPQANVILRDAAGAGALVASVPYGFGRVTVVALDLDKPPLAGWKALRPVLQKLAGAAPRAAQSAERKANRQLTHVGVSDLATQFVQSNEDFSAVQQSSYWSVLGWILAYLAVIGPLDFLFVHRVLRRPEWTWITLAILVSAGIALAAWYAGRFHAQTLQVNQFELIDVDGEHNAVRRRTWASLYSPDHRRFAVTIGPSDSAFGIPGPGVPGDAPLRLSWAAAPENALGGLYHSASGNFAGRSYAFAAAAAAVENVPIPQWSTKSLQAAWSSGLSRPIIDCNLESTGVGQLQGSIRHHLDAKLEDCLLVVAGWAYLPSQGASDEATLAPNVEWHPMGRNVRQRDLKALLTGEKRTRRNKEDTFSTEILTTTEAYNPLARSGGPQVAMISFHELAGGSEYTGLSNAALRGLEISDLMRLGRGVLIGRLAAPRSRVVIDGSEVEPARTSTWVRFVLPIRQTERVPDKVLPKADDPENNPSLNRGKAP